ncbi:hypothetical protein [Nocardioides sp. CER19]|uniref:hypothetical protein n=1 Tax=Nocardioides sp. CER19 TaxID=3038538 RepID=UPI002447B882|nr:hypothetical protein [Nocardioides sp. CER19]MDH2414100.1 hypothetical protein [Nocardioides sp. CER19]
MRTLARSAAVITAGLMLIPALAGPSSAAKPASLSGSWLARQLKTGVVSGQYGDDYGLTADTALALKTVGGHKSALTRTRKALAANVDSWVSPGSEVYAGSVAKAAVVAKALGGRPRSFGGANLIKQLNATVTPAGPAQGRIRDTSTYGDYANTIGQAYAARALSAAHSPKAGSVVRFLIAQQCAKGYFRLNFSAPTAASQKCVPGDSTGSPADPDVTSLALLSLHTIKHPSKKVRVSIQKATRWLKRHQRANGSFVGGRTTAVPNANSTGLAGWALGEVGACKQARKAAAWVKRLQVGATAKGALAHEHGAIAYDRTALATARTAGITSASQDQWRRATAQAAPALRFLSGC